MLSRYTLLSTSTMQVLNGDAPTRYPGIVLLGGIGSGKTAIIEQLVTNSCFHDSSAPSSSSNPSKHPDPQGLSNGFNSSPTSTLHGTQANRTGAPTRKTSVGSMSVGGGGGGGGVGVVAGNLSASVSNLNYASLQNLGSQVVAFHMCQADNNITCMVPDFVHSLSAYLTRAPQLQAYRDLLTQVGSAFGLFMVTPFLLLCLFTVTPFLLPSVCLQSHPFCCSQSVYSHNFSAAFSLFMVTPFLLLSVYLQSHPFCFQSVYGHTLSAAFSLFTVPFCFQSLYSHTVLALSLFTVTPGFSPFTVIPFLLSVCLQLHLFLFSLFTVAPFLLSLCLQSHILYLQSLYDHTFSTLGKKSAFFTDDLVTFSSA